MSGDCSCRMPKLDPEAVLFEKALEDVLASSIFQSSRQCQLLLRYVVEHSIAHEDELLRERVIGANVFGRVPDYDTGNDPVVRARAAELRKRLALYYSHADEAQQAIRIEIPTGSYRALFKMAEAHGLGNGRAGNGAEAPLLGNPAVENVAGSSEGHSYDASSPKEKSVAEPVIQIPIINSKAERPHRLKLIAAAGLLITLILGAGLVGINQVRGSRQRMFDSFWSPITDPQKPVLILVGATPGYRLSFDFLDDYRLQHHIPSTKSQFFIDLRKGETIDESQLKPRELIGYSDLAAVARMVAMLTRLNTRYDLRYGSGISVTDFRSGPTILLGGFSNDWTLEMMHQLRFQLQGRDHDQIVDEMDKSRVWTRKLPEETFSGDDYVVISRLPRSEMGNPVLAIAGIGMYANQAASDFLNDPDRLGALLKTLPKGWEQKNLQIILHTNIVKDIPGAVTNVEAWDLR